jgi:hypothetical protein
MVVMKNHPNDMKEVENDSEVAQKFINSEIVVTFKHLPQPLRSHIRSFGTLGQLLKIPPCPPKYVIVQGVPECIL